MAYNCFYPKKWIYYVRGVGFPKVKKGCGSNYYIYKEVVFKFKKSKKKSLKFWWTAKEGKAQRICSGIVYPLRNTASLLSSNIQEQQNGTCDRDYTLSRRVN